MRSWVVFMLLAIVAWRCPAAEGPPRTGRELLAQFGIDLKPLVDGRPLTAEETGVLLRVLYRWGGPMPQGSEALPINTFSLLDVERLARHDAASLDFAQQSARLRGAFFAVRGQVVSIEPVRMTPAQSARFDFADYYRCRLVLAAQRPLVVYARQVPHAWRQGAQPNEPGGALGAYLKLLPGSEGPLLVAQRIAWYPHTPLGKLGMDAGLLDDLTDRRPLSHAEEEAFFQMLAAVRRAPPGELLRLADARLRATGETSSSVVPLFNRPQTQRGHLVALSGTARRAIKIFVDDAEIVARWGIDHYYEIGLFTGDSQDNPLVICVPELPPGMPPGEDYRYLEPIRVAGFFLKVWAYRSARMEQGKPVAQLAPLVIAQTPVWQPAPPRERNPITAILAAGLLLLGLCVAGWLLWHTNTSYSK